MAVCCEYFYLAGTTKGEWIQTPGRCIEVVYYESRKIILIQSFESIVFGQL